MKSPMNERRPVEVAESDNSYESNSLEDCKQCIVSKLHSLQSETCLSRDEFEVLSIAKGNDDDDE